MTQMTVDRLLEKVLSKIQDARFNGDDVIESFNACCASLASILNIRQLATVGTVTLELDTDSIALPTNYHKKLHKAFNITANRELHVFESRILIDRKLDRVGQAGNVIAVAPDGMNLYCQRIPSTDQEIRIYYFAMPADIESGGEFPPWIPNNFLNGLFFHYAVSDLFSNLEDGINGEKVNTIYHDARYQEEFKKFETYIGPYPDHPYTLTKDNIDFNFEDL